MRYGGTALCVIFYYFSRILDARLGLSLPSSPTNTLVSADAVILSCRHSLHPHCAHEESLAILLLGYQVARGCGTLVV